MAQVRYIVNDVSEAVEFYVSKLGFELEQQFGPAIAILNREDLTLWVAGPRSSAGMAMPDGVSPSPGVGPGLSWLSTIWSRMFRSSKTTV